MDPRLSWQQVVWRVSINDVTCYFWFQVSDLTTELNLFQWVTTSCIKIVYHRSRCRQPIKRYPKKVKEPFGNNAECGPWINLYSFDARWVNVSSIVQGSIVFVVFEEHVLSCERDGRYFWLYMMTFGTKELLSSSGISDICVRNNSELASASISASLVSFERRSSSCMVIRAGILATWANMSKRKEMSSPRPEGFFRMQLNRTSFCFLFLKSGLELERVLLLTSFAVMSRQ